MIEISGLSKGFGKPDHHGVTPGLRDCNFVAPDGAITCLLGPNGAGKSTLLRVVTGGLRADAGTVRINGIGNLRRRSDVTRQLGVALDSTAIDPSHSAWTHLLWQAYAAGLGAPDALRSLDLVGLGGVSRKPLRTFSFGMLQRIALASALLGDPQTIVLDEPLNGLDAEGIIWLRRLLLGLAEKGKCLLVASHILSEVEATASQIVVLGAGEVIFTGTVAQLRDRGSGPNPFESAYAALTSDYISYAGRLA